MEAKAADQVERLAQALQRYGLATPALMLLDALAPLGFFGEQLVAAFGPLLPSQNWRDGAEAFARTLDDERQRDRFQRLLAGECKTITGDDC